MGIEYRSGDLLASDAQYLVHQCNCVATRPHALSAAIAARFPAANIYAERAPVPGKSFAIAAHRGVPGDIVVRDSVIAILGQVAPGRPGEYHAYGIPDTAADRERYFAAGLAKIAALAPASLAFPARIGCDKAGGDWRAYTRMLDAFAAAHPHIAISVVELPRRA